MIIQKRDLNEDYKNYFYNNFNKEHLEFFNKVSKGKFGDIIDL